MAPVSLTTNLGTLTSDVTTLLSRLTSTRAGLLDNIPAGTMPLASAVAAIPTTPINKIQQVHINIGYSNQTQNATITSVNTAKAAVFYQGQVCATGDYSPAQYFAQIYITSATTVQAYKDGAAGVQNVLIRAVVVEYK